MAAFLGLLALLGFFLGYIIIVGYFRAFVLTKLWGYFLVPLGLVEIGIWHAWGISLLVTLFTYSSPSNSEEKKNFVSALLNPVLLSLIAWGIGALIHRQM